MRNGMIIFAVDAGVTVTEEKAGEIRSQLPKVAEGLDLRRGKKTTTGLLVVAIGVW